MVKPFASIDNVLPILLDPDGTATDTLEHAPGIPITLVINPLSSSSPASATAQLEHPEGHARLHHLAGQARRRMEGSSQFEDFLAVHTRNRAAKRAEALLGITETNLQNSESARSTTFWTPNYYGKPNFFRPGQRQPRPCGASLLSEASPSHSDDTEQSGARVFDVISTQCI